MNKIKNPLQALPEGDWKISYIITQVLPSANPLDSDDDKNDDNQLVEQFHFFVFVFTLQR
ncbi:MAG TPA: hypothetical protein VIK29_07760 [Paludibacter sp.]